MGLVEVLRVVCVGCLLVVGAHPTAAKRIPRWWMKVAQRQGPNACVVEEVPDTGLEFWTECRYWLNRRVCGRRTRIRFECCEGFERNDDENGCTRVKPLMNLLETAESLGATKWAQYIRDSGLAGELESAAAYTLFAPTNEAFDNLRGSLRSQMEAYRGSPNNPVLLYHLLPTKLLSDDFQADMLAETRHQGHSVRINKYSNGMTTINCALLIRKDQHATNGVVHLISNILDPSLGTLQNVADMVLNDGRFTVLADVLQRSGYINVLRTMQGSVTVLAPSDEAFQKLSESRREKIINDREARLALIQNHVIPHVICESAVTGEHRVSTVSRDRLKFSCDVSGTFVETTKMRGNFNLGQNGIVHMIDDVLLPDRAKNLLELAESRQLHTFVDLVKKAGLEETLTHTGDYTFFVPDEAAWYALDSQVLEEARRDLDLAGQLVRFHGAYGRHLTNAITDNQAIMSLNEEDPVRLQVWRRGLGVEDARITEPDLEAQNGVIHIINKVITPSNQSIDDVLRSIPGQSFETFLEAVGRVSQEGEEGALLSLGPGDEMFYTFFVPSDRAFTRVNQGMLRLLWEDDTYTRQVVRQHVAVNMFPETSFEKNLVYTVNGMAGPFDIKKTRDDVLTVNEEQVTSSHLCANGVIHVINKAFMPDPSYSDTYGYGGVVSVPTRTSTRRTYKQTVTFAERYNGVNQELPGVPQGSVDSPPSRATRRRTTKRRRGGSFSSSSSPSSTTSPPPVAASLTTPPSRSLPTAQDEVEETHLEGTRLEAKEDEASLNALSGSPGGSRTPYDEPESYNKPGLRDGLGSRPRHGQGSYSVREGSQSSSSYNPSSTTSSSTTTTTTTSTSTYSSTSVLGSRDVEVQSLDGSRREASSSPSSSSSSSRRRPHHPDLDGSSSPSSPSSSSSSSSSSSRRRPHDPDLDGTSSPSSPSSSSSSSSSSRRRPHDPDQDDSSSPSSSSSSSTRRRPYDGSASSSSSSSSSSSRRRLYRPDVDGSSSPSSSSSRRRPYRPDVDGSSSSSSSSFSSSSRRRLYRPDIDGSTSSSSSFSSSRRRLYRPDLNDSSSAFPSSSSSSRRRPYGPDRDGNFSPSSSSSSSFSSTSRRRYNPDVDNNTSPSSSPSSSSSSSSISSSSTFTSRRYGAGLDAGSSYNASLHPSSSSSSSTSSSFSSSSRRRDPDLDLEPSSSSSSSLSHSITRTRFEASSGFPSPIPVPPRLPDGQDSSGRPFLTNHTRHSSQAGATTTTTTHSTDLRGGVTSLEEPITTLRGSETTLRGSETTLRGSETTLRGSGTSLRGSETTLRGSGTSLRGLETTLRGSETIQRGSKTTLRGSGTSLKGSETTLRGSATTLRGSETTQRGSETTLRGSVTTLRGSETTLRGSETTLRGSETTLRGSETTLRGSQTALRGSGTTLRESETNLRGYDNNLRGSNIYEGKLSTSLRTGTDASGSSTYVRESSTDSSSIGFSGNVEGSSTVSRGSSTNVRGSSTDIRGSGTVIRGSGTDLRGSSTVVGGSSGGLDTRVGGSSRGHTASSSRTYSYQYTGGASGLEARQDQELSRQSFGPGTFPSTNTPPSRLPLPIHNNTGSRRVSYVGHSYGQDVVGHTDQLTRVTRPPPIPYRLGTEGRKTYGREVTGLRSLEEGAGSVRALEGVGVGGEGVGQSVYKYSKTSHVQHVQGPTEVLPVTSLHSASSGRSTTTIGSVRRSHRRRYNITKTSYSYSVPMLHPRLPPPIRSSDNKLGSLSPVSAYAFTGDEDMYADGTEFAEVKGLGVESITQQEARELRRRFRKKRHHKRRGGKGRRRRGRRGKKNRVSKKADALEE